MRKIKVKLDTKSYTIVLENNLLENMLPHIEQVYQGQRVMIITDDHVYKLYGKKVEQVLQERYRCLWHVFAQGEKSKNLQTVQEVYSSLIQNNFTRSDLIIALGGGVVGDLGGFVASTYLRGIKYIQIPTTLLAQVDSSVGGKVAVDLPEGKNLVGSFYHPELVLIDPTVLGTLSQRYFQDGMGEVIKYALILSVPLYKLLKQYQTREELQAVLLDVIAICIECKRDVVEEDEHDIGLRMVLNFGHTIGHALEQYYQYERESHGEAVAIGMAGITALAEKKGICKSGMYEEIVQLLKQYNLPTTCDVTMQELIGGIIKDKKNLNGKLNVIVVEEIGHAIIVPTTISFFDL